ncbi:MAG: hypothetical protein V4463_15510 [Pseudomonadota bacterium]
MNTNTIGKRSIEDYDTEMETRVSVLEARFDTILPTLATKVDVEQLRREIVESRLEHVKTRDELHVDSAKTREELHSEIAKTRDSTRSEIHALEIKMDARFDAQSAQMQRMYSSALRWMVATLVTIVITQSALIVSVLRVIHP